MNDPTIGSSSPHWACLMAAGRIPNGHYQPEYPQGIVENNAFTAMPPNNLGLQQQPQTSVVGPSPSPAPATQLWPVAAPLATYSGLLQQQQTQVQQLQGRLQAQTQLQHPIQPHTPKSEIPLGGASSTAQLSGSRVPVSVHSTVRMSPYAPVFYPMGSNYGTTSRSSAQEPPVQTASARSCNREFDYNIGQHSSPTPSLFGLDNNEPNQNSFGLGMNLRAPSTPTGGSANRGVTLQGESLREAWRESWREFQLDIQRERERESECERDRVRDSERELDLEQERDRNAWMEDLNEIQRLPVPPLDQWSSYSNRNNRNQLLSMEGSGLSEVAQQDEPNHQHYPPLDDFGTDLDFCGIARDEYLGTLRNLVIRANDMLLPLLRGGFANLTASQIAAYTSAILNAPPLHPSLFMPANIPRPWLDNWELPAHHPQSLTPEDLARINERPEMSDGSTQTEFRCYCMQPLGSAARPATIYDIGPRIAPPPPPQPFGGWWARTIPVPLHPLGGPLRFPEPIPNGSAGPGPSGPRYGFGFNYNAPMPCRFGPIGSGRPSHRNKMKTNTQPPVHPGQAFQPFQQSLLPLPLQFPQLPTLQVEPRLLSEAQLPLKSTMDGNEKTFGDIEEIITNSTSVPQIGSEQATQLDRSRDTASTDLSTTLNSSDSHNTKQIKNNTSESNITKAPNIAIKPSIKKNNSSSSDTTDIDAIRLPITSGKSGKLNESRDNASRDRDRRALSHMDSSRNKDHNSNKSELLQTPCKSERSSKVHKSRHAKDRKASPTKGNATPSRVNSLKKNATLDHICGTRSTNTRASANLRKSRTSNFIIGSKADNSNGDSSPRVEYPITKSITNLTSNTLTNTMANPRNKTLSAGLKPYETSDVRPTTGKNKKNGSTSQDSRSALRFESDDHEGMLLSSAAKMLTVDIDRDPERNFSGSALEASAPSLSENGFQGNSSANILASSVLCVAKMLADDMDNTVPNNLNTNVMVNPRVLVDGNIIPTMTPNLNNNNKRNLSGNAKKTLSPEMYPTLKTSENNSFLPSVHLDPGSNNIMLPPAVHANYGCKNNDILDAPPSDTVNREANVSGIPSSPLDLLCTDIAAPLPINLLSYASQLQDNCNTNSYKK
ncbi:uncharacterized protein LOC115627543 [Scaptodrosophila lebanonensis]|uniref:Uncharacterized protein LOC115627543 n=1 Tax=Drosophila lebanonensis TaxID=7225 RepID=A0A6J2TW40_DROLE|nr:uncharacterized protein LOC115627543 [Scaptodrosophila lebanonensis]XP_030379113.1 uncharacterized protein LOC115627543 [Scaptodrosophila lebanonensis]XP_030379114.1 uncharacterized protein LOC115627543 [Scaptodrosophila lebanonensis]XP_030379116.1 uncharacterized protein LOC115627543 [Scaptodrosophila lebanonensis]XP_030379117.1 uncharacterized protein LOC115627543 [Scaptodrosophila lebanonensis]XP_030379118.1 uncharacterized protein LOC115627543 [Scaptodrosophila lebanonensis]